LTVGARLGMSGEISGSQWMGQTLAEVWTSEFGEGDRMRPIVDTVRETV
jgi:hypothetical protein